MSDLTRLFAPRAVAIVGASPDPTKIGYKIMRNLVHNRTSAHIHPVNPKGGEILGLPVSRSIGEIPEPVDLAVISIPADRVYGAVVDCAAASIPFAIIISSGFSEVGRLEEEQRIVAYAREHGVRIVGPNVFGIFSARASLNAGFGPRDIRPGKLAIISQSGAMGGAMIGMTSVAGIGLSAIIPLGNKADIDEADLLDFFRDDPETEIVLIYMEGVKQGERLLASLSATARRKPVLVIKTGRSHRGALAAASHTGALAGADEVFDDLMRQAGALRAERLDEALAWCRFLMHAPAPAGENLVVVTNGGGAGVSAADACEKFGVRMHDDAATLQRVFGPYTPPLGSTKNPIDFTGQATPADYERALEAALADPSCHMVLAIYCETALLPFESLTESLIGLHEKFRRARKPVAFCLLGGEGSAQCMATLQQADIPAFGEIYTAVSCLAALQAHTRRARSAIEEPVRAAVDAAAAAKIVATAKAEGRGFLLAPEGYALLKAIGLRAPESHVARTLEQALVHATAMGFPVVLKVISPDIIHKSDAGGVALDLESRDEVIAGYEAIMRNCRQRRPGARILGVEVTRMVSSRSEVIVGARRDSAFGPIVMFGMGGVFVELLGDVAFRSIPLTRSDVMAMMKETRAYRLLLGVRGDSARDLPATIDAIVRLASLVEQCPEIADIEVNPLSVFAEGEGVCATDVRVAVRSSS